MVRRIVAAVGVVVLTTVLLPQGATGSGGGACPPPITNGTRTRAVIKNFCYKPTVIHVRPGATVTWVNRDIVKHSITGANRAWGSYRSFKRNAAISFQFNRAGVYPYYCVLHVGMVGAVVVRDGLAPKALHRNTPSDAVTRVRLENVTAASAEVPPGRDTNESMSWTVIAGSVAGIGAMGIVARRIRRRRQA